MSGIRISFGGKLVRRFFLMSMAVSLCFSDAVFAVEQQQLHMLSTNDIVFYDPGCKSQEGCVAPTGDEITWIGDSYSVQAQLMGGKIAAALPGISFGGSEGDANSTIQGCKFVASDGGCGVENPSGFTILRRLIENGGLKPYLVFALGTNGMWSSAYVEEFKEIMRGSPDTKVILVNSKTMRSDLDYTESNQRLSELAMSNSNYFLADWAAVADESYFPADDLVHPRAGNGEGYDAWIEAIVSALPMDCNPTLLPGVTVAERVWNWFVNYFNNQNLSDRNIPAIISGIMGNLTVETGINPFLISSDQLYSGMHMLRNIYGGDALRQRVNSAIGTNYWYVHDGATWWTDETDVDGQLAERNIPDEAISTAINVSLEYYTTDISYWNDEFMVGVREWGVADTPGGYSDLFLATMERATPGSYPLEDEGVRQHYSGLYQGVPGRRAESERIYNKYAGATPINPRVTTGSAANNSSADSPIGNNENYAGEQVWSDDQMELIQEYRPVYESVAQQYGIPWQMLATMHRLEHGLQLDNPSNGQGIYQLYSYTDGGTNSNAFLPSGPVDMAEFQRQTNIAAEIMKGMIENGGYDPNSDEGAKYLMFSYNGRASQYINKALAMGFSQREADAGEGSPYVMNRYDARRDPNSSGMDPNWPGRFVGDGTYDSTATMSDFGGFVLYTALGGGGGSAGTDPCSSGGGAADGDLINYVRRYAWPEYHSPQFLERMPDYAEAVTRRDGDGLWVGGTVGDVQGIDCGGFVTTILNESGFDPDYNYGGDKSKGASAILSGQIPYLRSHPDEWQLVNPSLGVAISDESDLTPGDVAFSGCYGSTLESIDCEHTYLYIGEVEGFETHIASASYSERGNARAPMSGYEGIVRSDIVWFHKIK